jgi:hypothetical protein
LEPWLDDNKKRLKDKEQQRQQVKMILKHMAIGDYKQFKHAKHGGDLKDEREKAMWSTMITFTKMLIILSPC